MSYKTLHFFSFFEKYSFLKVYFSLILVHMVFTGGKGKQKHRMWQRPSFCLKFYIKWGITPEI